MHVLPVFISTNWRQNREGISYTHKRLIPACKPRLRSILQQLKVNSIGPVVRLIRTSFLVIPPILFTGSTLADPSSQGLNVNVNVEVNVNIPPSDGRSTESLKRARISFSNRTEEPVKVYWVDFGGNRRLYKTLNPGHGYRQRTYDGHVWVVTDMRENKLSHAVAEAREEIEVLIKKPSVALAP
jgi:hypothetical protein